MKYRKITIDLDLGNVIKHLEIDNENELKEYYEMKNRIDKAIEYMEESMNNPLKYEWAVLKHTLEILKGDSNE